MQNKKNTGRIFVVSGPSGSGKTTLLRIFLKGWSGAGLRKIITVTTRQPRQGERQGKDYYFVDRKEFLGRLRKGEFVESQKIFGEYYAVPKAALLKVISGCRDALLCVDVKGAKCIRHLFPKQSVLIFISAPDLSVLGRRLRQRKTEHRTALRQRLSVSLQELNCIKYYDYMIINDKLSEAVDKLYSIITAERLKVEFIYG